MLLAKMQMSSAAVSAPASDATVGNASSRWEVQNAEDLDDVSCLQGDAASGVGAAGDVDLRVARLELLIERRAILLSGVLLRQNPHNVTEVSFFSGAFMLLLSNLNRCSLTMQCCLGFFL
jgi:hypothetical protein